MYKLYTTLGTEIFGLIIMHSLHLTKHLLRWTMKTIYKLYTYANYTISLSIVMSGKRINIFTPLFFSFVRNSVEYFSWP